MIRTALASHRVGSLWGMEVRIAYLLYGVVGLFALLGFLHGFWAGFLALFTMVMLVGFVFLHEMGHSLAAVKEGLSVRAILLHPLGGLAQLLGQIPGPMAEIVIALAGPFVSLFLGALFFLPVHLFGTTGPGGLLYDFATINLVLSLFNFLPVFPLDGGRVALAILVMRFGPERAVALSQKVAAAGLMLLAALGGLALVSGQTHRGVTLLLIALLLYRLGQQELQARQQVQLYASPSATGGPWAREGAWHKATPSATAAPPGWFARRWTAWRERRTARRSAAQAEQRQKVDDILRKVNQEGIAALTPEERAALNQASQEYRERHQGGD